MSFKKILYYTSYHGFGVCERWSRFAGISTNKVRVAFLYTFFFYGGSRFRYVFPASFGYLVEGSVCIQEKICL